MSQGERIDDCLTWEPALSERLRALLTAVCAETGAAWCAVAMARLAGGHAGGQWVACSDGFPPLEPPSLVELFSQNAKPTTLRHSADQVNGAELDAWLMPLRAPQAPSATRSTTALVVEGAVRDGGVPPSVRQIAAVVGEYELRYLAGLLLTALEHSRDPVELTDFDARVFYVNRAWRHYFGYTSSEALGHTVGTLLRDDQRQVHDPAYLQFTESEVKKRRQWLGTMGSRNRDGESRFNEVMVSPFDEPTLDHHGNFAVRRDLSHREGRDAALASAHREFRSVLSAMPDAVVVLRGEVVYFANRAFASLVGRELNQVIGQSLRVFVHAEDWPDLSAQWDAGVTRSVRFVHHSTKLRIAEVSAAGDVSFEGFPSHILTARDVTERVLSREQIARSDRLSALGALAAGVAHEINNPLAYVMLNLEAAREHTQPALREAVDEAIDGARRIGAIVAELRGFWNGAGDTLGAVDVTTAVASAVNLAQNEIRHRAELVRHLEHGLIALARHEQVVQVLVNLLLNAAQAIPDEEGVQHFVRVASRSISPTELEISVADTGRGIPPESQASLFEPLVHPTAASPGFGLAISKRMVEELNGSIEVSSTGPSGTKFSVRLPRLVREEQPPDSRISSHELLHAPYRVLVVDDEPLIARAIKRALGPFVVQMASDGLDALAVLESSPEFDVILCDLMMPKISGADLFRRVSQQFPSLSGRFVFMTGGAFADWSQRFLENADRPVIEKPFQPAQLRSCIEAVARETRRARRR